MDKKLKIIIVGGGTAGHINPGLAIANRLQKEYSNTDILFIGTSKGMENDLVPKSGFKIECISAEGFKRRKKIGNIIVIFKVLFGLFQSLLILNRFRPDIVIGTGGYVTGPMILAAKIMRRKILLHEQNALPGITNIFLSRIANVICTSYGESEKYLKRAKKIVLTGNPIRESILEHDRLSARKSLKLSEKDCYVLIYGGSLGAEKINEAVVDMLNNIKTDTGLYIKFATGRKHYKDIAEKINRKKSNRFEIVPYIYDMDLQLNAADLLVTRGGAITLSEATAAGKPLIIIPSPYVAENHQMKNAMSLKDAEAAEIIEEKELTGEILHKKITELTADRNILKSMAISSYKNGIRDATERIFNEIQPLL